MSISGDTQHMHTFLYLYNKYSPFDLSFNKAMKTKKKNFSYIYMYLPCSKF